MKRLLVAALLAIIMSVPAGAVIGSHTALADAGGSPVNITQCLSYVNGEQICYTAIGEVNTTTTPSGNVSSQFNGTQTEVIRDSNGTVLYSDTEAGHFLSLSKNGTPQVNGTHYVETVTGSGTICTITHDYHYAGGSVQYNNGSISGDCPAAP